MQFMNTFYVLILGDNVYVSRREGETRGDRDIKVGKGVQERGKKREEKTRREEEI